MAQKLILTTAGLDEMIAADQSGTDKVVISACALGSTASASADKSWTALKGEFKRISTVSGGAVAGNVVHVEATDGSSASYSAYEVGLFSSSGTLIAVAASNTPIIEKASGSVALIAFDIALDDISATTLYFGDTTYINPQATETVQGVAEIATTDEVAAGTDDSRIVTPKKLVAWVMAALQPYLPKSQLLDKTWPVGSVYMSVNSTSPATLFGGTWERVTDCFLYAGFGSGDFGLGKTGGAKTATLSVSNMPAHAHGGATAGAGSHTPSGTISGGSHTHSGTTAANGKHTHTRGSMNITGSATLSSTGTASSASGAFSVADSEASGDDNNGKSRRTTLSLNASKNWTGSTSEVAAHTHTITTGSATPSMKFTGTTVGNHTHGVTSQGGGEAFSIMPPYLSVFMWKRTA